VREPHFPVFPEFHDAYQEFAEDLSAGQFLSQLLNRAGGAIHTKK
jgi:hypothetical protein